MVLVREIYSPHKRFGSGKEASEVERRLRRQIKLNNMMRNASVPFYRLALDPAVKCTAGFPKLISGEFFDITAQDCNWLNYIYMKATHTKF